MPACAHPRCSEYTPGKRFACPRHWSGLPDGIRNDITIGLNQHRQFGLAVGLEAAKKAAHAYWEREIDDAAWGPRTRSR